MPWRQYDNSFLFVSEANLTFLYLVRAEVNFPFCYNGEVASDGAKFDYKVCHWTELGPITKLHTPKANVVWPGRSIRYLTSTSNSFIAVNGDCPSTHTKMLPQLFIERVFNTHLWWDRASEAANPDQASAHCMSLSKQGLIMQNSHSSSHKEVKT